MNSSSSRFYDFLAGQILNLASGERQAASETGRQLIFRQENGSPWHKVSVLCGNKKIVVLGPAANRQLLVLKW
jgi:hypothetical protein